MSVDINSVLMEQFKLLDLPGELREAYGVASYLANVLWNDGTPITINTLEGRRTEIIKGEEGFRFVLEKSLHRSEYSMSIRRLFAEAPRGVTYYRGPIKVPKRFRDVTFLCDKDSLLIMHFKGRVHLYEFTQERTQDGMMIYLPKRKLQEDEITAETLVRSLEAYQGDEEFKEFNEAGKRKVGSLIKYLKEFIAKSATDEEIERPR